MLSKNAELKIYYLELAHLTLTKKVTAVLKCMIFALK